MKIYIAGAWVEQHQRARPMIAKAREAGLVVTYDWTVAEGDACACGQPRSFHASFHASNCYSGTFPSCSGVSPSGHVGDVDPCDCTGFNGIGGGSDSALMPEQRRTYAQADLDGVLTADVVWLLAANDKGACGSWVELGAALALRQACIRAHVPAPHVVVSGAKNRRTIFTELTDCLFDTDVAALERIIKHAGQRP